MISAVKGRLTDKLNAGKAQLVALKDTERDLNYDLADKSHAETVDTMTTSMGAASGKLGMFTHTVRGAVQCCCSPTGRPVPGTGLLAGELAHCVLPFLPVPHRHATARTRRWLWPRPAKVVYFSLRAVDASGSHMFFRFWLCSAGAVHR